ncbi:MAG: 7TM diverse intracellular signaling domain-containing protein, partial [Caldilineaceae bacterium]
KLQETVQSGDRMPARRRPYPATTLVLPFHLAAGASTEVYVRAKSEGAPLFLPFEVLDEQALQPSVTFGWVLSSVLLGVFIALFVYNFFVFSLLRSRLYLYYVLFLPIAYLTMAGNSGFGSAYLYPNNMWLGNEGIAVFSGIPFILAILILREFLQTHTNRWVERWMHFLIVCAIVLSIGPFFWSEPFGQKITAVVIFIYPTFCLVAGIIAWRQGQTEVRFYIIGQVSNWSGLILIGLMGTGVLPYHLLLYQSPILGVAGDALMLSFALADRIRILQVARLHAEDLARKNLEIRQEELERLVAERTAEIKTLHGILPICANCKKIRDEEGAWQGLETYISQHTDAQFSHGICTDCMKSLYPTIYQKRQQGAATQQ